MPPNRRLSIAHLSALDASPLDFIAAAAMGGFDAVGLRLIAPRPGDVVAPVIGNPGAIRAIKRELAAREIGVLEVEAVIVSPGLVAASLAPAFETAAEIGAGSILANMYIADRTQAADAFAALCLEGARFGLDLVLEFLPISELRTIHDAAEILALAAAPNGRLLVDALHLCRSGGQPSDIATIPPSWMTYAHLCDAPLAPPPPDQRIAEVRSGRLLPGEGELPLRELIQALPPGASLAVEAPCRETAGLPVNERVARAGGALRALLATI